MKLPIDILTEKGHRIYKKSDWIHCPGCGAQVSSDRCEYCGLYFVDYGCLDADKPFWLKIKKDGLIHMIPVRLTRAYIYHVYNEQLELTFDIMTDD